MVIKYVKNQYFGILGSNHDIQNIFANYVIVLKYLPIL